MKEVLKIENLTKTYIKSKRKFCVLNNVNYNFNVQGIGISAQIFITLSEGGNNATVDISPNFNSNNMTLTGKIVPLSESSVFKGRAL